MIPKAIPERAATGSSGEDGVGDAIILFYCATKVALLERLPSAHTPTDSPYPARVGRASPYPQPTSLTLLSPSPSTHALRILQFSASSLSNLTPSNSPPPRSPTLEPHTLQLSDITPSSSPPPHSPTSHPPTLRPLALQLSNLTPSNSPTSHPPVLRLLTLQLSNLTPYSSPTSHPFASTPRP